MSDSKPNTKICFTVPQLVQFWWDNPCQIHRVHPDFDHLRKKDPPETLMSLTLNFTYLLLMKQIVYPSEVKHKIISVLLLMGGILHQLRLVVPPIIYKVSYIPGGCLGFLPVLLSPFKRQLYHTVDKHRCPVPSGRCRSVK